ncbi:hypothetical protein [Mesorhizobium sp. RIZ17]|uniref:hypothetical protein n=1 Tax=Mesorhizobium sp. RIZ17 TaxID=3132743 RepID=UPI003DA7F774
MGAPMARHLLDAGQARRPTILHSFGPSKSSVITTSQPERNNRCAEPARPMFSSCWPIPWAMRKAPASSMRSSSRRGSTA